MVCHLSRAKKGDRSERGTVLTPAGLSQVVTKEEFNHWLTTEKEFISKPLGRSCDSGLTLMDQWIEEMHISLKSMFFF